jgi:hypothetical protein
MPSLPFPRRRDGGRSAAEPGAELARMNRNMLRDILGDCAPCLRQLEQRDRELRDADRRVRFSA